MYDIITYRKIKEKIFTKERYDKMNKTELVNVVADATGLKKKEADAAVSAVFTAIADALKNGDKVQCVGFGTFDVKERAAREGRNPATGEKITIAASKSVSFSASSNLKNEL